MAEKRPAWCFLNKLDQAEAWSVGSEAFTVGFAAALCLIQPVELVNVCGRRKKRKDENRSNGKETAETFWVGRESLTTASVWKDRQGFVGPLEYFVIITFY